MSVAKMPRCGAQRKLLLTPRRGLEMINVRSAMFATSGGNEMKYVLSVRSLGWLPLLGIAACSAGSPEASVDGTTQSTAEELRVKRCDGPLHSRCGPHEYCSSLKHDRCPGPRSFGVCAKQPE